MSSSSGVATSVSELLYPCYLHSPEILFWLTTIQGIHYTANEQPMFHTKLTLESKLICTYFQSNSTPRAPNHSGSMLHIKNLTQTFYNNSITPHHNRFTALFLGLPGWAGARRKLLDFMVQGKINRGRHTDHPAGCHSIRTNQCPPPSPHFLQAGCPSCCPTNSVKALKANFTIIVEH